MSKDAAADASVAQSTERRSHNQGDTGAVDNASRWCIRTREILGLNQLPFVLDDNSDKNKDSEENNENIVENQGNQNIVGGLENVVEELPEEQTPLQETSDYAAKRKEILKKYYATPDPDDVTNEQAKRLENQRNIVFKCLPKEGKEEDITEAGNQLEVLKLLIATVESEVEARLEHLRLVEIARQKLKTSRFSFPLPPPNLLDDLFESAKSKGQNATTVSEYKQANELLEKMSKALADAEEYSKLSDQVTGWLMNGAGGLVSTGADSLKSSKELAAKGNFGAAIAELEMLRDDVSLKDFMDYNKALSEFWAAADGMIKSQEPLQSFVAHDTTKKKNPVPPKKGTLAEAKMLAITEPPKYNEAAQAVRSLLPTLLEMKQYHDQLMVVTKISNQKNLFEQLDPLDQEKVNKGIDIAKKLAFDMKYVEARNELDKLLSLTNVKNEALLPNMSIYLRNLNAVFPTYNALQAIAKQSPAGLHTSKLFKAAQEQAKQQNYSIAAQEMDNLNPIVKAAYQYVDLRNKIIDLCDDLEQPIIEDLLKQSISLAEKEDYEKASTVLQNLLPQVQYVGPYHARRGEVVRLNNFIDSEQKNELNEVLIRAAELATSRDFEAGLAALQEVKQMPGLREVDSDMSTYMKQLANVSKVHDATLKLLEQKKPVDQSELRGHLNEKLKEAKSVDDGKLDIKSGFKLLDELSKLLDGASLYGKERLKAYAMANFLVREKLSLEDQLRLWEQERNALEPDIDICARQIKDDETTSKSLSEEVKELKKTKKDPSLKEKEAKQFSSALNKRKIELIEQKKKLESLKTLAKASSDLLPKLTINAQAVLEKGDEAGLKLDFPEAMKRYEEARSLLKKIGEELVNQLEKNEAGHCLSAHGPATSLESQKKRVMTGERPDGVRVCSQFGCKFDKIEDFIVTRQLAIEKATENPPYPNWSFDDKVLKPGTVNGKTTYQETIVHYIEHDRPIDTAVIGLKPNVEVKESGPEFGEVVVARTYETLLTVSGLTRTRSTFSFQKNKKLDQDGNPCGKWVLLQQFPEAQDWEPDEPFATVDNTFNSTSGRYTAPLPGA